MPAPQPIPEAFHELLARPVLMSLATTLADGTIQLTPVWFNFDGAYIYFNSEKDRLKHRILRQRPKVSLLILDPDNKARWLAVRGSRGRDGRRREPRAHQRADNEIHGCAALWRAT